MSAQTYYVALPFNRCREGHLVAAVARECADADAASREAEAFGRSHAGAVAFYREIDKDTGRTSRARILNRIGDVPNLGYLLGG